jgi:hypothetical protein
VADIRGALMDKVMQWAISRILDISAGGFFGSITLRFENGKPVHLEHHRSEKPPAEAA